ncbi:MAG: iron ABC transporter permease [Betaproteobacteria bacterium]|nr:iron ABC transporter permease [Betaproteobacteria bacterium]
MTKHRRAFLVLLLLCALALGCALFAMLAGSVSIAPGEALTALFGQDSPNAAIITRLRAPRVLAGFACGGLLALAGALMQVLLKNPLADPYILGISGGAGVGAMLALFFGLSLTGINMLAFAGALGAILIVFGLAHGDGSWTQTRLLLTGVIVAAGCGALVTLVLSLAPERQLRGMLFWLMGDLAQVNAPLLTFAALIVSLAAVLPFARELNLLARGGEAAQSLGVAVPRLRRVVYAVAAFATAVAVTSAGTIGFVGLIVPHLVRLLIGNDQRFLLPTTVLAGGSLLLFADTLARTLIAPQQLPVGVLTALIGVPVFLFLLSRHPRQSF